MLQSQQGTANSSTPTKPRAYINYILFDDQFRAVSTGFSQVGDAYSVKDHYGDLQNIPVTKNGYLYVYCSNESPVDVFFDNLQVVHTRGPLLEETHYYPFGLTMKGISSGTANIIPNKKKYNGIEKEDDLAIDIYDAQFRELDQQTGRWWQIDPVTDAYENLSPYASMYDNPLTISDPLGNEGETCCWEQIKAAGNYIGGALTGVVIGTVDNVTGSNFREQAAPAFQGTGAAGHGWNMGLDIADAGSLVSGTVFTIGGGLTAGAGGLTTVVSGGTTAPVSVPATGLGVAVAVEGVHMVKNSYNNIINQTGRVNAQGTSNSGSNSSGGGKSKNKLEMDKSAGGDHTTYKRDQNGNVYKYQEWNKNDKNPNKFDPGKRFDGGKPDGSSGNPHNGVPTPHVNDKNAPGGVRLPTPQELPKNIRF